jgi:hypothetical protein
MKMKVFQCSMGPELRERLRVAAAKSGHPEAELTRRALLQFLDKIEKKPGLQEVTTRR